MPGDSLATFLTTRLPILAAAALDSAKKKDKDKDKAYMEKRSDVAEMAILAKKIGGKSA